jgi:2-methylcitrate dehydratase PrpD
LIAAELSRALIGAYRTALPPEVSREAKRSLFNVLGVAIGGARHEGVDIIIEAGRRFGAEAIAAIPGRTELGDPQTAALATGFAAHVDDFDDTHLVTVIHPASTAVAALFGVAPLAPVSGAEALRAFALGCEAQLRVGVAISPEHYDRGWHITGTCGVIGAAAAAGLILGLNEDALARAIALSANAALGHREAFGTMTKPFHPGKGGANGLLCALLARAGVDAPSDALEAANGFTHVFSSRVDLAEITGDFGARWELLSNTYKPYPCGIVAHPAIDAALALAPQVGAIAQIASVEVRCHPLVPELMGNPNPVDGLQARFSAIHGVSAALCDRTVGLAQYETARVRSSDAVAVRAKTRLVPDQTTRRDEARIRLELADGRVLETHVEHARGSLARPLTDEELHAKVAALVEPQLGDVTEAIADAVHTLDAAPSLQSLLTCVTGRTATRV